MRRILALTIAALVAPHTAQADDQAFGAILTGPTVSATGLVTLTVDETAADFGVVLLIAGLPLDEITGAELRDDAGQTVFDLVADSGALFGQGGEIVRLSFGDQPIPVADFVGRLVQGLYVVVTTRSQPDGALSSLLIEGLIPVLPAGGGGAGADGEDTGTTSDEVVDAGNGGAATDEEEALDDDIDDETTDDGAGQPVVDLGDAGDALVPQCGLCGPLGVVSYVMLLAGWLVLKVTPRRR